MTGKVTSVNLDESLKVQIKKQGKSISETINEALKFYLSNNPEIDLLECERRQHCDAIYRIDKRLEEIKSEVLEKTEDVETKEEPTNKEIKGADESLEKAVAECLDILDNDEPLTDGLIKDIAELHGTSKTKLLNRVSKELKNRNN